MDHLSYTRDSYAKTAQKLGYRSRASLKLIEIHEKFNIFKPGNSVLDLGAAPGGWCQVANKLTKSGKIIGVDILPIESFGSVQFIQQDITTLNAELGIFNIVMSDMCANKTGNKAVDDANMFNLGMMALNCAKKMLSSDGVFICKFFYSPYEREFFSLLKQTFTICSIFKPKSSRDQSSEIYFYCKSLLNP